MISYGVPQKSNVRLTVVDVMGRTVAVLESGEKEAGQYAVRWNASSFSSGIYFLRLEAGTHLLARKVSLMK